MTPLHIHSCMAHIDVELVEGEVERELYICNVYVELTWLSEDWAQSAEEWSLSVPYFLHAFDRPATNISICFEQSWLQIAAYKYT